MRQKRLPQSKSKSQTPRPFAMCACNHSSGKHNQGSGNCSGWQAYRGKQHRCDCLKFLHFEEQMPSERIANAPSVPQETLSEPEAYIGMVKVPDVVITRDTASHHWCIVCGHVKCPIPGMDEQADPVMVAKYLASRANGPINVVWW